MIVRPPLSHKSMRCQSTGGRCSIRLSAAGFRVLAAVDDYSRECLALVADSSLSGLRMARELGAIIKRRGQLYTIVSDNGTELTSTAVLK